MASQSQVYKATIEVKFNYKKNKNAAVKAIKIDPDRIQYMMLQYKYESVNVLPIIYLSMRIPLDLHDKVLDSYEFSTFSLIVKKKNVNSPTSAATKVIDDIFDYVCANTNINQSPALTKQDTEDRSYVITTIGMVSKKMSTALRCTFGGSYVNIDTQTLIKDVALKGMKNIVMSDLKYITQYKRLEVSALNTRYKMLKYIYDEDPYYDTKFTFFMDFNDIVYLIAKDAKPVKVGSKPANCIMNITDVIDKRSLDSGNKIVNDAYLMHINAANVDVKVNEGIDRTLNKFVGFDYDIEDQNLYLGSDGLGNQDKSIFARTDNAAAEQNEYSNNRVLVNLFKSSIDSSILTPNKCYMINHLSNYSKFDGKYILSTKSESYTSIAGGEFKIITSATFKLVEVITKAHAKQNDKYKKTFTNPQCTTTADQKPTGGVTIANRSKNG